MNSIRVEPVYIVNGREIVDQAQVEVIRADALEVVEQRMLRDGADRVDSWEFKRSAQRPS